MCICIEGMAMAVRTGMGCEWHSWQREEERVSAPMAEGRGGGESECECTHGREVSEVSEGGSGCVMSGQRGCACACLRGTEVGCAEWEGSVHT